MSINIITRRTFNTIKSKNDERLNQALLGRLKNISLTGGKKTEPPVESKPAENSQDVERNLTFAKLSRLVNYYTTDPLMWDTSMLCRVFKIPEDSCENLVKYVQPMVYYANSTMYESKKLMKTPVVIDVNRLKSDEKYLPRLQQLVFLDIHQKDILATE